jgi:hypothetical protein
MDSIDKKLKGMEIILNFAKFVSALIFGTISLIVAAISLKILSVSGFSLYAAFLAFVASLGCSLFIAYYVTLSLYKKHSSNLANIDKIMMASIAWYFVGVAIVTFPYS